MVEDSETDSRLVLRELQQGGYEPQSQRVETAAELTAALATHEWDVVLCDFRLPRFTALAALELIRASGLDLPFILVSGAVGEEQAVALMKAGAHDFVLKDGMARLAPAVTRELGDAEARRQRRQAVAELSRTNEKLQGILNSITDGLAVLDRNWCFTYFSEQAANILGIRPEQLLGGCLWELFPHTKGTKHFEEYHRAVETGQPVHFEDYYPEPFNLWLECHCYPSDESLSVYFRDITDRKQAEASLRKSENMLALAIDAGQLGIWNWDQFTRTLVWSERCNEMTGLPRDSDVSMEAALATIHPEDRAHVPAEATRALENQVDIEMEFRTLWPDGTVRWLQTRGRAIDDATGKLVRITGIIQDVTGRRESEDALRRFNNQLESLVEERTEVIKMTMRELQREFAERRRLEEEILDIGERAQAQIGQDLHDDLGQQLVGMSIIMGILSSRLKVESHPCAADAARLETFLSGVINTTRNLARSLYPVELERGGLNLSLQELANRTEMLGGVTCRLSADEEFKLDKAVEIHLYRIVQESISNALKHGKARNIAIDCTVRDGVSTLTVTDDGSGFVQPEDGKWSGIGLHLFQYRARLIGAQLTVVRGTNGGCQVKCSIGESKSSGKPSLQTESRTS